MSTKFNKSSIRFVSEKKISYTIKTKTDAINGNDGHIYRIKKIDEIQEILIAEREINETNLVQNITEELILLV